MQVGTYPASSQVHDHIMVQDCVDEDKVCQIQEDICTILIYTILNHQVMMYMLSCLGSVFSLTLFDKQHF